jgi:hypothetical protein
LRRSIEPFKGKSTICRWHGICEGTVNPGGRLCVPSDPSNNKQQQEYSMKLNHIITVCAIATTLALSVGTLFAQDNGNTTNGGQNGGGQRRNRTGGGPGGGNFDPAQFQQQMMDRVREQLNFTNDTDWEAVQPLVQKVMDARREVGNGGMGRMFGGRNRGGQNGGPGGRGGMFGQPSPEQEALQKALDDDAPAGQVKDLLAKYKASQKAKQTKLEAAQADLKAVLTSKQEAQAYLLGLVN